jgi:hypothetical protein
MKYRHPLRRILELGREYWDRDDVPSEKRRAFEKVLQCRTPMLGAEVYASEKSEKIVYHTCKSRACPTCGHRATIQWQRERWVALPNVPYKGITFTMPKEFWPIFCESRRLADALPAIAAAITESIMRTRHGIRIGVMAILHTFNGRLDFNSHVHTIVTAGGFQERSSTWVDSAFYDRDYLTRLWRASVIKLIRTAYRAGRLRTGMTVDQLEAILATLEHRWWSVRISSFESREHHLRYSGRYVRRPPIAQRRITVIDPAGVGFWTKDKKLRRIVTVKYALKEFIERWIKQLPDPYRHAMRYFGLFAPRTISQNFATIFSIIGQRRRPRPKRLPWALSIKRDFGWDPLLDHTGNRMRWVRRLPAMMAE